MKSLFEPATMSAAVNAALTLFVDDRFIDEDRLKYLELLDRMYVEGQVNQDPAVQAQAAIAGVVRVLVSAGKIKLQPLDSVSVRRRLSTALSLDRESGDLPAAVLCVAEKLFIQLPPENKGSVCVLGGLTDPKALSDADFRKYKRLLEPIALADTPELGILEGSLMAEFQWMASITQHIVSELKLAHDCGRSHFGLRPILLVGEPGVGKTRYWRRLCELAGVPFRVFPAAGSSDSMSIRGTSRGWSTARPSAIVQLFLERLCANPLVQLDELEKAGTARHNGNMLDVLLTMLEPETSVRWFDEGLDAGYVDLSHVSFVATANSLLPLPRPLLDRFSIYRVPAPAKEHYPQIIDSVLQEIARSYGLADPRLLPQINPQDRALLVQHCDNVRQLVRGVRVLLERAVLERSPAMVH